MNRERLDAPHESVTRLHEDVSDAINIMYNMSSGNSGADTRAKKHEHVPKTGGKTGRGARWDIFRVQDVKILKEWLGKKVASASEPLLKYFAALKRESHIHDHIMMEVRGDPNTLSIIVIPALTYSQ